MPQTSDGYVDFGGSLNCLPYMFFPSQLLVEYYPQELYLWRWLNSCPLHNNLSNTMFSFPPSDVDQLGFLQRETGTRSSRPCFNPGDILLLNLPNVVFCGPTHAPAEVVVNEGRRSTEIVNRLIHEV